jgi:hypothetical protein
MEFKFYQPKRLGFIKIPSAITLELDLVFLHIFYWFLFFSKILKQWIINLTVFKFGLIQFHQFSVIFEKTNRFCNLLESTERCPVPTWGGRRLRIQLRNKNKAPSWPTPETTRKNCGRRALHWKPTGARKVETLVRLGGRQWIERDSDPRRRLARTTTKHGRQQMKSSYELDQDKMTSCSTSEKTSERDSDPRRRMPPWPLCSRGTDPLRKSGARAQC